MEYKLVKPDEYRTVPWKNGRGVTKELVVCYSDSSQPFIWRISIAAVTENGTFSDFTGYDRVLIMLEGKGVRLEHSNGIINELKSTSDIAYFSGGSLTSAILRGGPIRDFNVMTLKEKCRSEVNLISLRGEISLDADETCFYAGKGNALIEIEDRELSVPEGHLLRIEKKCSSGAVVKSCELTVVKIFYL